MLWALLTTLLFALSAVSGQRTAIRLGGLRGNFWRLAISATVLSTIVLIAFPDSLAGPTFAWFFFSGLVGFGVGDVGLFLAYERIGSRLAILLNLCLAPIFAATVEWLWLGNALSLREISAAVVILTGVALALKPDRTRVRSAELKGRFSTGVVAALVAGLGQGTGAVISRKANEVEHALGLEINGISEAGQRVVAGVLVAALAAWIWRRRQPGHLPDQVTGANRRATTLAWLAAAALTGPVIGVSCFQQALAAMGSGGLVLAVVAITPIVLMPMAWWVEKDRPNRLSVIGAILAVTGVILLNWLRVS
ncbi:MAG: DMT family transporter [Verrucomicrobiae bacterium]|nr:DMT family transporter [Verrucomicrobiae bacterium]